MLSTALSIGASGLRAMQAKMDLHSDNIANANTPGYSRRDSVQSTVEYGGVTSSSIHRFNPVSASRIAKLEGEVAFADTRANALDTAQKTISDAATGLSSAFNALNTNLAKAALTPGDSNLRTVLASQAGGIAHTATGYLTTLDNQVADLQASQVPLAASARQKMEELVTLNKAVAAQGLTPALRDRQAQVGKELSELVGGNLRFQDNGQVGFEAGNSSLVQGDTMRELPKNLTEGRLGGVQAAIKDVQALRNGFASSLQDYAGAMNTANSKGTTQNGLQGGELFALKGTTFTFTGAPDAFALQQGNGQALSATSTPVEKLAGLAARAATDAAGARSGQAAQQLSLNQAEAARTKEAGVDMDREILELKTAQRLYEANSQVIKTADSMLGTLLNLRA